MEEGHGGDGTVTKVCQMREVGKVSFDGSGSEAGRETKARDGWEKGGRDGDREEGEVCGG